MRSFLAFLMLTSSFAQANDPAALKASFDNPSAAILSPVKLAPALLPAQQEGRIQELTPATIEAAQRGLQALAKDQNPDGSLGNGTAPLATTALGGLAFLASGSTPNRGAYSKNIRKCLEFILKNASPSGYINEGNSKNKEHGNSVMYGHGYSLLFLSQVYGMGGGGFHDAEEIRDVIVKAVRLTEQAQHRSGGWYYTPSNSEEEGSVTVTQVQSLRAVRDAGIAVNLGTINKAIGYINQVTDDSGQTAYALGRSDRSAPITAAGMCVLAYLGKYDSPKIPNGLNYLLSNFKPGTTANSPAASGTWNHWYFYGNYYASLAMYQKGGKYWNEWWPAMRDSLLGCQDASGLWKNSESATYGDAFGTSLALIMLQIPNRYLPILQRGQD